MKKTMIYLIVFLALISVCSAETDDSQYIGTWVSSEDTLNHGYCIETIHLTDDKRAFYLLQMFTPSEPTYSYKYVGKWEVEGHHAHTIFCFFRSSDQ